MKILEITAFSSGICGLWSRVCKEAELLAKKGHEVHVFSSNIKRGSGKKEIDKKLEQMENIAIHRFKTFTNFGDNTYFWNYEKQALDLKPDIIICHAYRQYYSTKALKIARKLNIPCILVTHAPFLEKKLRNWKLNLAVFLYDKFIGKKIINKYNKVFTITKWEIPHLMKLGLKKEKIFYSPNGIPEEFFKFKIPKNNSRNKILFLGRLAPIKDIETLVKAFKISSNKNKKLTLTFVGPIEKDYELKIKKLVNFLKLKNIKFNAPVYDLKNKITIIDKHDIFILSSKREGMPQALIEAMARKKLVISSKTEGGKEIIENGKNGYLFDIGNEHQLFEKINLISKNKDPNMKENARKDVEKFSWETLIDDIEKELIKQVKKS